METLVGEMLSIENFRFTEEDKDRIEVINQNKRAVANIIQPHYDELCAVEPNDKKKIDELITIGRYISQTGENIKILECRERPDFLVKYNDEVIGVELTSIYDDNIVAEINTFKSYLEKAQLMIQDKYKGLTGLFNIVIAPDKISLKKKEVFHETIFSILDNYINRIEEPYPDYVINITLTDHEVLELSLGEQYWLKKLSAESVVNTIKSKEAKIAAYKEDAMVQKVWLLIVLSGASAVSSFKIDLDNLPVNEKTLFDKIIIYNSFNGKIIEGYNS